MTRGRLFAAAALMVVGAAVWFAWPWQASVPTVQVASVPVPYRPVQFEARTPPPEPAVAASLALPAYLRHLDPSREICRQASLASRPLMELIQPGGSLQPYLETQIDDLRAYLIDQLGHSADVQHGVAAAILRGDPGAAADLARRSNDGKAYAMAWRSCRGRATAAMLRRAAAAESADELRRQVDEELADSSAKCDALSLERWAQLEPDNASPWLQLAREAEGRADRAATVDAMHRAAQARTLDTGWGWMVGQMADVMPEDAPEAGRMLLYLDVISRQSVGSVALDGAAVGGYCNVKSLADSNVRQQCEQLAQLLTRRSPQLMERMIGAAIAKRLYGDAAAGDHQALADANAWMAEDFQQKLDQSACAALRYQADSMVDVARRGEWAAVQSRRAASKP